MTENARDIVQAEEQGGLEEELKSVLKDLGLKPSELRKYFKAAKRLRELERQYGKSYQVLLREYEKKFRESVKLEYQINELLEKRQKIEEDLKVYLEQHNLTLETVNKVIAILMKLQQYSLDVTDLENIARAAAKIKEMGLDVETVFDKFAKLEEAEQRLQRASAEYESILSKLEAIKKELESKEAALRDLINWEPEVKSLAEMRQRLENEIRQLEEKKNEMSAKVEELAQEYEALYGFKGSAEEVFKVVEEKKAELERLTEEVNKKRETVELLEEEVASARSLLMLLQNPEMVSKEDLETLIRQLTNIVNVKTGELSMLKPLEKPLVENVRRRVVELIMPAIKNDLIPKWVFEKLEREFKEVVARKAQLEEEIERLKASISQQAVLKQPTAETEAQKPSMFFRLLKKMVYLTEDGGVKIRLKCPYCQSINLVILPSRQELENAMNDRDLLVITCQSCGKDVSVDPGFLKTRFYPG
jgi:DNA repair exonuclease SbcCD ATPase subunit